jgi:serine/threonine protein kinase
VRHPNIVGFVESMETTDDVVLVLQYVPGGELFDYIAAGKVDHDEIKHMFYELASGDAKHDFPSPISLRAYY